MLVTRCGRTVEVGESYVALAADHLVAIELGGESLERGLNDTTTETEDEVKSRLLYGEIHVSPAPFLPRHPNDLERPNVAMVFRFPFQISERCPRTFWML